MILDKIKSLSPKSCFIGGDIKLIVGKLGIVFHKYNTDGIRMFKEYKEDDQIPIIQIKDNKVSISLFNNEIWVKPDGRFKGIIYLTNK